MAATKAIAARIPMEDFIKFQQEAIQLKMSINDFVIMKLYTTDNSSKRINELNNLCLVKLYKTCDNVHNRLTKLHNTVSKIDTSYNMESDLEGIIGGLESMISTLEISMDKSKLLYETAQ